MVGSLSSLDTPPEPPDLRWSPLETEVEGLLSHQCMHGVLCRRVRSKLIKIVEWKTEWVTVAEDFLVFLAKKNVGPVTKAVCLSSIISVDVEQRQGRTLLNLGVVCGGKKDKLILRARSGEDLHSWVQWINLGRKRLNGHLKGRFVQASEAQNKLRAKSEFGKDKAQHLVETQRRRLQPTEALQRFQGLDSWAARKLSSHLRSSFYAFMRHSLDNSSSGRCHHMLHVLNHASAIQLRWSIRKLRLAPSPFVSPRGPWFTPRACQGHTPRVRHKALRAMALVLRRTFRIRLSKVLRELRGLRVEENKAVVQKRGACSWTVSQGGACVRAAEQHGAIALCRALRRPLARIAGMAWSQFRRGVARDAEKDAKRIVHALVHVNEDVLERLRRLPLHIGVHAVELAMSRASQRQQAWVLLRLALSRRTSDPASAESPRKNSANSAAYTESMVDSQEGFDSGESGYDSWLESGSCTSLNASVGFHG